MKTVIKCQTITLGVEVEEMAVRATVVKGPFVFPEVMTAEKAKEIGEAFTAAANLCFALRATS